MKPLGEQLAFYRSYHRSPGCKATHFFGVPLVTFAILVALGWVSFSWPGGHFTGAMAFVLGTLAYYFRLDRLLATLMTLIMIPTVWTADWASRLHFPGTLWVFLGSLALGVGFQAWGHILEGKRPALVDNFFQAVFTSPLFLLIEALESLGWKPGRPGNARA